MAGSRSTSVPACVTIGVRIAAILVLAAVALMLSSGAPLAVVGFIVGPLIRLALLCVVNHLLP
jgi:hypothetical protein